MRLLARRKSASGRALHLSVRVSVPRAGAPRRATTVVMANAVPREPSATVAALSTWTTATGLVQLLSARVVARVMKSSKLVVIIVVMESAVLPAARPSAASQSKDQYLMYLGRSLTRTNPSALSGEWLSLQIILYWLCQLMNLLRQRNHID